jgi:hypothetical protein
LLKRFISTYIAQKTSKNFPVGSVTQKFFLSLIDDAEDSIKRTLLHAEEVLETD